MALIPMLGATSVFSTYTGRSMMYVVHYKRMPLVGGALAMLGLGALAIWPVEMPLILVLVVLGVIGLGLGTIFPISTVCMQNAVTQHQLGIATGAANFFRALLSALLVAVLGAIVVGGLGGHTGTSVEVLIHAASAPALALAFRFVFIACELALTFGMLFLIAMEEQPLRGPSLHSPAAGAPSAPATPIPSERD